jgi:hypothetical protein
VRKLTEHIGSDFSADFSADFKVERMRKLIDHIVSGDHAEQLWIEVVDEPGSGGANHAYVIGDKGEGFPKVEINFQKGPIKEAGVNGITQEALLAIVIDRLRSFQAGPFASRENALALTHIETGLLWLQKRTVERIKRGVEGTHQK